jgi:hypothetical protein
MMSPFLIRSAYCEARGLELIETFVGPGASATNDRRPEFQRMIEAGISKPTAKAPAMTARRRSGRGSPIPERKSWPSTVVHDKVTCN